MARKRPSEAGLHGRIAVKKPLFRKKKQVKKTRQKSSGIKSNQISKSFSQIGGPIYSEELWERFKPHKARRWPCYGVGGYLKQSWRISTRRGKTQSDRLLQYTGASGWNAICGYRICSHARYYRKQTRNVKERGTAGFSTDDLIGAISRFKPHYTALGWTWLKIQSWTSYQCRSPLATFTGRLGRTIFVLTPVFDWKNAKNLWSSDRD